MPFLRPHRPAAASRHSRTLPSLAVAVGIGMLLVTSLLAPASAASDAFGTDRGPGSPPRPDF